MVGDVLCDADITGDPHLWGGAGIGKPGSDCGVTNLSMVHSKLIGEDNVNS